MRLSISQRVDRARVSLGFSLSFSLSLSLFEKVRSRNSSRCNCNCTRSCINSSERLAQTLLRNRMSGKPLSTYTSIECFVVFYTNSSYTGIEIGCRHHKSCGERVSRNPRARIIRFLSKARAVSSGGVCTYNRSEQLQQTAHVSVLCATSNRAEASKPASA